MTIVIDLKASASFQEAAYYTYYEKSTSKCCLVA